MPLTDSVSGMLSKPAVREGINICVKGLMHYDFKSDFTKYNRRAQSDYKDRIMCNVPLLLNPIYI